MDKQNTSGQSPLKILHVIAGSAYGGAETFCLDAIVALHERGVRQHVICRPHARYMETLKSLNIPFETMKFNGVFDRLTGKARIRIAAKNFAPDIVHAWMGRAASFIPKGMNAPVLGWFGGYYQMKRYRTCDFFAGVTQDIVDYIVKNGTAPQRAFLLHTFGTLQDEPAVERAALSTPADAPVALMLSRMHWKKGVDTLLNAAMHLPDFYIWIAGEGPERGKYEALADSLGIADRVRFLGWRTDRAALLKAADVCVLPSRYEPFGTVIAEAWHMGVPLVATKADGARQYIRDGMDGLLCEIEDAEGLAAHMRRTVAEPALREMLIANGRLSYERFFSRDIVIGQFIQAYETMAQTRINITMNQIDKKNAHYSGSLQLGASK